MAEQTNVIQFPRSAYTGSALCKACGSVLETRGPVCAECLAMDKYLDLLEQIRNGKT